MRTGGVMPVMFDVTDRTQIQAALDTVDALDILINNAGCRRRRLERLFGVRAAFGKSSTLRCSFRLSAGE